MFGIVPLQILLVVYISLNIGHVTSRPGSDLTRDDIIGSELDYDLEFRSIDSFEQFVLELKQLMSGDHEQFINSNCYKLVGRDLQAIFGLHSVITHSADDVCHPSHIDMLIDYHNKFIKDYEENSAERFRTRDLFKIHALKISGLCKMNLLLNLKDELVNNDISEEDYHSLVPWFPKIMNVEKTSRYINDFDDLPRSAPFTRYKKIIQHEDNMEFDSKTREAFFALKATCSNKMRPIYATTILPVVRLAEIGYSMKNRMIDVARGQLVGDEEARKWYTIVEICELFRRIDLSPVVENDPHTKIYFVREHEDNRESLDKEMAAWPRHDRNSFGQLDLVTPESAEIFDSVKQVTKSQEKVRNDAKALGKALACVKKKARDLDLTCMGLEHKNQCLKVMELFQSGINSYEIPYEKELLSKMLTMLALY